MLEKRWTCAPSKGTCSYPASTSGSYQTIGWVAAIVSLLAIRVVFQVARHTDRKLLSLWPCESRREGKQFRTDDFVNQFNWDLSEAKGWNLSKSSGNERLRTVQEGQRGDLSILSPFRVEMSRPSLNRPERRESGLKNKPSVGVRSLFASGR